MAEVSRTNAESQVPYRTESNEGPDTFPIARDEQRAALPATGTPANNPAWNRSAEVVGRGVGTAVAEVRRIPRRLDGLKSRIHLVSKKAGSSAEGKAAERRDAAEIGLLELADKASVYTSEIGYRAADRLESLRSNAWWKLEALRTLARHRVVRLRQWKPARPLQVVVISASAAFALGVMLRIWRSNSDA